MIVVNRRDHVSWHEGLTVAALLDRLRYTFPHIIVTVNGELVPRDAYATHQVPDSADVRVLHLMAGG
jgi:sulfur carrier protein